MKIIIQILLFISSLHLSQQNSNESSEELRALLELQNWQFPRQDRLYEDEFNAMDQYSKEVISYAPGKQAIVALEYSIFDDSQGRLLIQLQRQDGSRIRRVSFPIENDGEIKDHGVCISQTPVEGEIFVAFSMKENGRENIKGIIVSENGGYIRENRIIDIFESNDYNYGFKYPRCTYTNEMVYVVAEGYSEQLYGHASYFNAVQYYKDSEGYYQVQKVHDNAQYIEGNQNKWVFGQWNEENSQNIVGFEDGFAIAIFSSYDSDGENVMFHLQKFRDGVQEGESVQIEDYPNRVKNIPKHFRISKHPNGRYFTVVYGYYRDLYNVFAYYFENIHKVTHMMTISMNMEVICHKALDIQNDVIGKAIITGGWSSDIGKKVQQVINAGWVIEYVVSDPDIVAFSSTFAIMSLEVVVNSLDPIYLFEVNPQTCDILPGSPFVGPELHIQNYGPVISKSTNENDESVFTIAGTSPNQKLMVWQVDLNEFDYFFSNDGEDGEDGEWYAEPEWHCPSGYMDLETETCKNCNNEKCGTCYEGPDNCINHCDSSCKTCDSFGNCLSCQLGYTVGDDLLCFKDLDKCQYEDGYFENQSGDCLQCDNSVCGTCIESHRNCVVECNEGCRICDPNGQCLQEDGKDVCVQGYAHDNFNNICVNCDYKNLGEEDCEICSQNGSHAFWNGQCKNFNKCTGQYDNSIFDLELKNKQAAKISTDFSVKFEQNILSSDCFSVNVLDSKFNEIGVQDTQFREFEFVFNLQQANEICEKNNGQGQRYLECEFYIVFRMSEEFEIARKLGAKIQFGQSDRDMVNPVSFSIIESDIFTDMIVLELDENNQLQAQPIENEVVKEYKEGLNYKLLVDVVSDTKVEHYKTKIIINNKDKFIEPKDEYNVEAGYVLEYGTQGWSDTVEIYVALKVTTYETDERRVLQDDERRGTTKIMIKKYETQGTIKVKVKEEFYETAWFIILCSVLGLVLLSLISVCILKKYRKINGRQRVLTMDQIKQAEIERPQDNNQVVLERKDSRSEGQSNSDQNSDKDTADCMKSQTSEVPAQPYFIGQQQEWEQQEYPQFEQQQTFGSNGEQNV